MRSVPAGSDGLLLLPYLTGERTPDLPNASGVLRGITLENFTAAHRTLPFGSRLWSRR